MAYITNSNFKKIVRDRFFATSKRPVKGLHPREDEIAKILSKPELALLQVYKEMCETPNDFPVIFIKIQKSDTLSYVVEGRAPAYHLKADCYRLHSDFKNFAIPEVVRSMGEDKVHEYRVIFQAGRHMIDEGRHDVLAIRLCSALGLPLGALNFKQVDYNNSGMDIFENLDLEEVDRRISEILFDAERFRHHSKESSGLINDYGYGTHRRAEAKQLGHTLYIWHNQYKAGLKNLLETYFRVKFNPELNFEGRLLDRLGFVPCKHCDTDVVF